MPKRNIDIEIELTGEKAYKQALDNAVSSVRLLGLQVKENATAYKQNADSAEGNRERIALLKKEIEAQQKVIDLYTERIEKNKEAGRDNTKEQQRLEEGLIKARTALAAMNNDLDDANSKFPSFSDRVKEAAGHIGSGFVTTVKTAATATGAAMAAIGSATLAAGKAILQLVNDTSEYRTSLSMLQQNSTDAGVAFDSVKNKMIEISAVTGDTGAAVEAVSNLLATGFNEQGLTKAVDALSGAVIKFPDTLKIESLADGLQETIATGAGAGAFAELIERMGGDLEEFNTKLAACTTEAERQEVALKWLADSGLADVSASYRETNKASLSAQEASLRMNDALTSLAGAVEPAVATVKAGLANVVTAFVGMVTGAEGAEDDFEKSIDGLIDNVTAMIDEWLPKVLEMGSNILIKLTDGLLKAIPKLTESLPKVINTLLDFIVNNLPQIIDSGIKIIVALAEGIIKSIPNLVAKLPEIISAIVKGLASGVSALMDVGKQLISGLWDGIASMFQSIKDGIANFGRNVVGWFKDVLGIHSPSTVMRDQVGKMLGLGVAEGLLSEKSAVQNAMNSIIPDGKTIRYSVEGAADAARSVLSARAASPAYSIIGNGNSDMSDSTMRKLSDAFVSALTRSGFADQVIVLNDREVGRYMRRGLEVGFV